MKTVKMGFTNLILLTIFLSFSHCSPYVTSKYETNLLLKATGFRLPNNTVPRRYTIKLEPHIENDTFTFDGTSSIIFEVIHPSINVIVHVAEVMEIDKTYTRLLHSDGRLERPISQRWNPALELLNIKFNQTLDVGNYTIEFSWKANGVDHSIPYRRGFFRRRFRHKNGSYEYMVATHFEPIFARSVYPCWDEPGFKSEFEISIKHDPKYVALSNMPLKEKTPEEGGKVWTIFKRSPVMSTYMTHFVVTQYAKLVNNHQNMTVWSYSKSQGDSRFLFDMSPKLVAAYENYTGISYPLPKLDSIIIPDFASSANEHWGLISYANYVLFNPETDSIKVKHFIATLASHEISHQWFGNLVTHVWWNELWLTEAFAVFMSNKILDDVSPTWHAKDIFATEVINEISFVAEQRSGLFRPIRWMPQKPNEIRAIFGPVTYRKGAAVIYMLEHILSEEVFHQGIQNYLKKHQFGSVTTDDLWDSLQDAYTESRAVPYLNIKQIMDPWLEQTGFPLLNVSRHYETGYITITQSNVWGPESMNRWMIPITFMTGVKRENNKTIPETRPTHWLRKGNESLVLYDVDKNDWILLNIKNTGFYQVIYDWENWRRIAVYLNSENYHKIHVINRAQLFYDMERFSTKDEHSISTILHIMSYLSRERDYLPWIVAVNTIEGVRNQLKNSYHYESFRLFALGLMNEIINKIGFEDRQDDDPLPKMLRQKLVPLGCSFGHEKCRILAQQKLIDNIRYHKTITHNSKDWVYCTALSVANQTLWDAVLDEHFQSPSSNPVFEYLGCTNNTEFLDRYLRLAFNSQNHDSFDSKHKNVLAAFKSLTSGPIENYDFALNFFIEKITGIRRFMSQQTMLNPFTDIIELFVRSIGTSHQLQKLSTFLTDQSRQGDMGDIIEAIEHASGQVQYLEKVNNIIASALQKRLSNTVLSHN